MPLGLLSIAKYVADVGHAVKIYDRAVEDRNLRKVLDSFKPDIVGISTLTNKQFHDAAEVSREVKKMGITVVWGGATASAVPEVIINSGVVDYVVIGEGEKTLKELLDALQNNGPVDGVDGLAYLKDGKVCFTGVRAFVDLADTPILDFSYVEPEKYFTEYIGSKKMLYLYTSKGCPFTCSFCYNHCFNKHQW